MNTPPPKWIDRLLNWYCSDAYINEIQGDLLELYRQWIAEKGVFRARCLYVIHSLLFLRLYNSRFRQKSIKIHRVTMVKHYVQIAIRTMNRHKRYALANILGLALGMSISLMIFLHINGELRFEHGYPKHENIYRLSHSSEWAMSSPSVGQALHAELPEVANVCRIAGHSGGLKVIRIDDKNFETEKLLIADQAFLEVFDVQFSAGMKEEALTKHLTAVISESFARKVFGQKNPVGKTFQLNNRPTITITGVMKDLPEKSHIQADILISMETMKRFTREASWKNKGWMAVYTYVLFRNEETAHQAIAKIPDFQAAYEEIPASDVAAFKKKGNFFQLMPLTDIHFHSHARHELQSNSNISYIYVFATLAVFILIIACVNFINIFTTLSMQRLKEVGLRKVLGAQKSQLIQQFFGEALFATFISAMIAMVFCLASLPFYNSIAQTNLHIHAFLSPTFLFGLIAIGLLVGIVAGLYPAFAVARFDIRDSLAAKGKVGISMMRRSLIVMQFVLSLAILTCTVVVSLQMNYIQKKDLGYTTDHVVAIKIYIYKLIDIRESLYARLKENPSVIDVGISSNLMGDQISVENLRLERMPPSDEYPQVNIMRVDDHFLETMDIEFVSGRNFHHKTDTSSVFIINETLARMWNEDAPVGEMALLNGQERGPIIGVVKDFNFFSLHQGMVPVVFDYKPLWANFLVVKINPENVPSTLTYLEEIFREVAPASAFHYRFLDDHLNNLYQYENGMHKVFRIFAVLAVLISCIGLIGLAAMEVQRRTKEIGIRKVLGASGWGILGLLSRQFVIMVGLAICIAIPVCYLLIDQWLAEFAYHIPQNLGVYIWSSLAFAVICFTMVFLHGISAARSNPTDSLRYE